MMTGGDMIYRLPQALWWCDVCRTLWQRSPRWSGAREEGRSQHPKLMAAAGNWCEGFARRLEDPAVLAAWTIGGLEAVAPMYPDHVFRYSYQALVLRQVGDPEVTLSA